MGKLADMLAARTDEYGCKYPVPRVVASGPVAEPADRFAAYEAYARKMRAHFRRAEFRVV